jgi:hypothetical protein
MPGTKDMYLLECPYRKSRPDSELMILGHLSDRASWKANRSMVMGIRPFDGHHFQSSVLTNSRDCVVTRLCIRNHCWNCFMKLNSIQSECKPESMCKDSPYLSEPLYYHVCFHTGRWRGCDINDSPPKASSLGTQRQFDKISCPILYFTHTSPNLQHDSMELSSSPSGFFDLYLPAAYCRAFQLTASHRAWAWVSMMGLGV